MIQRARRLCAALGLAALAFTVTAASAPPHVDDGYLITMSLVVPEQGEGPMTMTIKAAGDRMRFEMDFSRAMGADASSMQGMFGVLQPGGKVAIVMPQMQMGVTMDLAMMLGRGTPGEAGVAMKDMTVDVTDLGSGGTIIGYATRKYHVRQKYSMTVTVFGQTITEAVNTADTLWVTQDLGAAEGALKKFQESFGSMMGGGMAKVADSLASKMPKGFPLRTVSVRTDDKGKATVNRAEITEIKKATFAAAEFEIPAGINLMDMGAMMGGRGRGGLPQR
jgi:hypothetical protein